MRHDYANFGFDRADVIIAVGYELQEFDPVRINPRGDKKIIHIHRFPAEVDAHYDVSVGITAEISASLDALAKAVTKPSNAARAASGSRNCSPPNSPAARSTTASRWRPPGSSPTPEPPWTATTSCWSTPAR